MEKNDKGQEKIPRGQEIFDNILLLFLVSLVLSAVLYNVWGLLNLLSVPLGQ